MAQWVDYNFGANLLSVSIITSINMIMIIISSQVVVVAVVVVVVAVVVIIVVAVVAAVAISCYNVSLHYFAIRRNDRLPHNSLTDI